jgi:hypothetical protein
MSIATILSDFIMNWSSKEELYFKIGVASDIDESDFTFKFTPIDEKSVVEDVRMKVIADGSPESFVIIPKEGTKVVVGFHSNTVGQCLFVQESEKVLINTVNIESNSKNKKDTIETLYEIICDDVRVTSDSFIFNGGTFDGLVKINDLTTKLNKLVSEMNSFKDKFNSHKHLGVSTGGGVSGLKNVTSVPAVTVFNKTNYENPKIKH